MDREINYIELKSLAVQLTTFKYEARLFKWET